MRFALTKVIYDIGIVVVALLIVVGGWNLFWYALVDSFSPQEASFSVLLLAAVLVCGLIALRGKLTVGNRIPWLTTDHKLRK